MCWAQTDRALANTAPLDLGQLNGMLRNSVRRIRKLQRLLWSCIYASAPAMDTVMISIIYTNINNIKEFSMQLHAE